MTTPGCSDATYSTTYSFTAIDDCGNTDTDTYTLTVIDTIDPILTAAADLTLECGSQIPDADYTVSDDCGSVEVEVTESQLNTCGETYILTRIYTATDDCGNSAADTQTITIVDTTPPYFMGIPADETAECDMIDRSDLIIAMDICDGEVPFTYSEAESQLECVGTYLLTRTWTAVDECGNSTLAQQVVTVIDTTSPIWEIFRQLDS